MLHVTLFSNLERATEIVRGWTFGNLDRKEERVSSMLRLHIGEVQQQSTKEIASWMLYLFEGVLSVFRA